MQPFGCGVESGQNTRRTVRSARGFVLIEVLFAIGVLVVSAIWLLAAYNSSLQLNDIAQQTSVALDDLRDMMEKVKSTPFTQLTTNFPNGTVNAAGYVTIVGGFSLANEQITVTHQPNTTADPRELIVQITWTNQGRTYQKSESTFRSSKAS